MLENGEMQMSIRLKILIPMVLIGVGLAFLGYQMMESQLSHLRNQTFKDMTENKTQQILNAVDFASAKALETAALFTRLPAVIQAYQLAHGGNIEDEADEKGQAAREMLRRELKPLMEGYSEVFEGEKLKLHFHLPNGHSLVRMWREKQSRRDGTWRDISDDLSEFRGTVLDVNRLNRPVRGIELGRGGFVIRGIAPIPSSERAPLGSVEVLIDFNPILNSMIQHGDRQHLSLFMNADRLPIIQDPSVFPVIQGKYVHIYGTGKLPDKDLVDVSLLDQGRDGPVFLTKREHLLNAFPVKDYNGRQIGIIVYASEIAVEEGLIRKASLILVGTLIFTLILLGLSNFLMFSEFIVKPLSDIVAFLERVADGDLSETLAIRRKDEIGRLMGTVNHMVLNFSTITGEVKSSGNALVTASEDMTQNIGAISATTEEISLSASNVSESANQMLQSNTTVASAIEEMSASMNEVGANAHRGSHISEEAVQMAGKAQDTMASLGRAAKQVGEVTDLIKKIADKTTLLALNADIEAASAGDAGKGFAVVANEIKTFARQSTQAADDIAVRISDMQTNSEQAVAVIGEVSGIINSFSRSSEIITAVLEEQMKASNEIASHAAQANTRADDIAYSMAQLAQGINDVSMRVGIAAGRKDDQAEDQGGADRMDASAAEIERLARALLDLMDRFKVNNDD